MSKVNFIPPHNPANMHNQQKLYWILFLAMASCTACREKAASKQPAPSADTLNAFIVSKKTVSKNLLLPAELIPYERAELFAKIQGYVKQMKADIGDRVQKGQVLAIVEAAEYNANLLQSKSSTQSAKAKFQSSKDYYDRLQIAAKEPGAVAASELVKAHNQTLEDSAAYAAAQQASEAYSQLNNYLVIKAPFNGVVTQRNADAGALVSSSSKPLLVVENNKLLRLRVPVPETFSDAINSKTTSFTVDALPERTFSGSLSRKSGTIDLSNRTELWEFLVNNDSMLLRSGMYANVKLSIERQQPTVVVPYSAVATTLEKKFLIKYRNNQVLWTDVRTGISLDSAIEVFGDVQPGDTVLVKATDELKPGTHVQVKIGKQK